MTSVVADTGDFESLERFSPEDATTNPSLILKAAKIPKFGHLIDKAINYGIERRPGAPIPHILDMLAVLFGCKILEKIPGYVSTEVDAHLSYDVAGTVKKGKELIALYKKMGVDPSRILLKIAATWEGIEACRILQRQGINCNMTLLFSKYQAIAAGQYANAFLISPFVGRISDYWKKTPGSPEDPGVGSVTSIYNYYKQHGIKTIVMGASFRSKDQILALAGCDKLTIAPKLLKQLQESSTPVQRKLSPEMKNSKINKVENINERNFRWELGEDECGTFKLAEGIRRFAADTVKLEKLIEQRIAGIYFASMY